MYNIQLDLTINIYAHENWIDVDLFTHPALIRMHLCGATVEYLFMRAVNYVVLLLHWALAQHFTRIGCEKCRRRKMLLARYNTTDIASLLHA